MAAVKISGVLKDGAGKPIQNCTIQLKAKRNSTTVLVNTVASENPDEAGRYSMDVEYGQYSVTLLVEGFPPSHAGTITVYEDSQPGTLNDFLGAMTEDDARPEALRRFELMVEEVARNASAVAQNTAAAKKSASDACTSAREAATHATDAAGSARAASTSAGQAASSAQSASSSAGTASTKATEASKSAAAAESSKSAAATSASAAKTSETNAKSSETAAGQSAAAAAMSAQEAKDAAGHVQGFIHDHLSVSARYSVTEANRQLQALRINSGRYEGLWRYLNANGGINWYFLFLAVYESEGKCFSLSDRMTICEKALRLGLVVPFMTGCRYEAGQRLTINGTLFFVNIAGTTGETLPDISSVAPGDFVRTGSAVLECLKSPSNRIPAAWQYFFLDVAPDLYTPVAPDSTDSYPALWFACIAEFADSTWLQESAGIGGSSRWEIIKQVAKFNIVAEINPVASLVNVLQHNLAPGDRAYAQCFCQDNAEVYAGLRALKTLADLAGDTTAATEYTAAMKTIRAGLLALFVPEQKRFLTYYNETDYPAEPGEGRFVDKDRFSVAPWRFGVLETQEEVERYGRQVLDAIQSAYPDLFTANYDGIDTFAMSDFFAFVAKATTSQTAATAAIRRLQIRATSAVTVADVAAAISVTAWGKIPQFRACDFMRINGHSVLGGGDITLGAAATMEPQSDIRDRTEGRLALPDAFGFGRIFNTNETVRFDSENDFLVWVKQVTPGEYFVDGGSKIISGGVLFNGVVS
ncbi:prophage tail fiber N-terminal domain-containing protein, partial [Escherichia coli]|uniref:prophage tail fiber N-terminal domain-containing protein n=1 Tax=Escherichia coli TaxID=562 RepID=UPI00201A800F